MIEGPSRIHVGGYLLTRYGKKGGIFGVGLNVDGLPNRQRSLESTEYQV